MGREIDGELVMVLRVRESDGCSRGPYTYDASGLEIRHIVDLHRHTSHSTKRGDAISV